MHATAVAKPFHRDGWVYEEKYVRLAGGGLQGRPGRAACEPAGQGSRAAAVAALPARTLILDGEIAVFDTALVSRFEWLRERPKNETATAPMLIAFDCLYARRNDLRGS